MSMFFFSALSNGQAIVFDPAADTLFFDAIGISASGLTVTRPNPDETRTQIVVGTKTITLNGLIPEQIDSWNFVFANGSRLLVGNDYNDPTGTLGVGTIEPDSYANFLYGGQFNDQLLGLEGDDTLNGGLGNDVLDGGEGTDTATYDDAAVGVTVSLATTAQQNTVGAGLDTLRGIENLTGSAFNDRLTGNAGANVLEGLAGNDLLDGGGGVDTADYGRAASAVRVSLATTAAQITGGAGTDTLLNIENLTGSSYNDILTGNGGANVLSGGTGDDTLAGGAGNDVLDGGAGNDSLSGGTGNDTYYVDALGDRITEASGAGTGMDTVVASVSWTLGANLENLTLAGGQSSGTYPYVSYAAALNGTGNALANVITGNSADNVLDGGAGIDTVSYAPATNGVQVNLGFISRQTTGWGRDTLRNFENVTGSAYADRLVGNGGANVLTGGVGDDVLVGGAGNDTLKGDAGSDTASYFNASAAVTVSLLVTAAQATGGAGTDQLAGIENLQGSAFNDTLTGDTRNNVIEGLGGNDTLIGGSGVDTVSYESASAAVRVNLATTAGQNTLSAGTDTLSGFENLRGSAFNDTLTGNTSANVIDGGAGGDAMAGGAGNDIYRVDTSLTDRMAIVNGTKTLVDWSGRADTVTEAAGAGTDTVETYVDFSLPANVENLTAMEFSSGTGYYSVPSLILSGNGLDNLIVDNAGSNTVDGGGGIDTFSVANARFGVNVSLGSYSSYASSGSGYDRLTSIENIIGSAFDDSISVDGAGNRYDGGAGIDTLSYASLWSSGSPPGLVINLGLTGPQDTVGAGVDTIVNFENLTGGSGDDRLTGNAADNILSGGSGSDILEGGAGNDTLYGANSNYGGMDLDIDTASYATAASAVTVNLGVTIPQNTVGAGIDTLISIDNLTGSAFNDTLTGSDGANVLSGGAGNDTLNGGAGDDTLVGGLGSDTLNGGAGFDTADYSGAASAVSVNLGTGAVSGGAGNDTITVGTVEQLIGSAYNDTLTGSGSADTLRGGAGNDTLSGAAGNDLLIGGAGNDALRGDAGIDTASYADATAAVTVNLGNAAAQNTGGAGTDTLTNVENLVGSTFNDTLTGSTGDNLIDGGGGNDTLAGGDGNDTLSYASFSRSQYDYNTLYVNLPDGRSVYGYYYESYATTKDTLSGFENVIGSAGRDALTGNADANRLTGAGGTDTLTGGDGADQFRFATPAEGGDSISDFVSGTDKIEVVSGNFGGLAVGVPLDASRFKTAGTTLTTGAAVFLFDGTSGALTFDADGNGSGAAVAIATLTNAGTRTLVASDIQVVAA